MGLWSWRNRMVAFYKNNKFRSKFEIPKILQERYIYGKQKSDKESTGPAKKQQQTNHAWRILNFLPPLLYGEHNQ